MLKKMLLKFVLLSTLFVFALASSGCMRQAKLVNYNNLPVTGKEKIQQDQVKTAIVQSGASLGWVIQEVNPGLLRGTLNLRAHSAIISIPYSASSYSIIYKDSTNLKYDAVDQTIHNQYNNWVINLRKAIDTRLAVTAAK